MNLLVFCIPCREHKASSSLQPHTKPFTISNVTRKEPSTHDHHHAYKLHSAYKCCSNLLSHPRMAPPLKNLPRLLLCLNFCMYAVVVGIGAWSINRAIDHGFTIGKGFDLPAHFSPIYFPMGNAATGFFVIFSLIAGVVGVASAISGLNHIRYLGMDSLPAAAAGGTIAWSLTVLAMGFAWKQIDLSNRNSRLITMEAFITILSATQLFYIALIHACTMDARVKKSKEEEAEAEARVKKSKEAEAEAEARGRT